MKHMLFLSDALCLEFKTRPAAFNHVLMNDFANSGQKWLLVTEFKSGLFAVFNPYISESDDCVEYFETFDAASKYVGSFL